MRIVSNDEPLEERPPDEAALEEDFPLEAEPSFIEEIPVEEFSPEDFLVEEDVYGDGAYATDDLVPEPEVDWRSAENADWDI
jgi:hypothetical protein